MEFLDKNNILDRKKIRMFYKNSSVEDIKKVNLILFKEARDSDSRSFLFNLIFEIFSKKESFIEISILVDTIKTFTIFDIDWLYYSNIEKINENFQKEYIKEFLNIIKQVSDTNHPDFLEVKFNCFFNIILFLNYDLYIDNNDDLIDLVFTDIFINSQSREKLRNEEFRIFVYTKYLQIKSTRFDERFKNVVNVLVEKNANINDNTLDQIAIDTFEKYLYDFFRHRNHLTTDNEKKIFISYKKLYKLVYTPVQNIELYLLFSIIDPGYPINNLVGLKMSLMRELPSIIQNFGMISIMQVISIFNLMLDLFFEKDFKLSYTNYFEFCYLLLESEDNILHLFASEIFIRKYNSQKHQVVDQILKKMSRSEDSTVLMYYNIIINSKKYKKAHCY